MNSNISENIIIYLLKGFFKSEMKRTSILITLSIIMNIIHVNIFSKITADIINSAHNFEKDNIYYSFKYFIFITTIYLVVYHFYKKNQFELLSKLRQWIKQELISIILNINNNELKQINISELIPPINRLSSASFLVINNIISQILPNLILLFVIIIYFTYKNRGYGLIFLLSNIIIIASVYFRYGNITTSNSSYMKKEKSNENSMVDILNNIDKIIYRAQHENESNTYEKHINDTIIESNKFYLTSHKECFISAILLNIAIFINIGHLIKLCLAKTIDIKLFITFFTMILIYRERFFTMIQNIPDIAEFVGRANVILYYFNNIIQDYKSVISLKNKFNKDLILPLNTIVFENVSFKYKNNNLDTILTNNKKKENIYVLKNLNLKIKLQGIVGIIGPSGSGKSTFGKLIIKLYKYDGKIKIDGIDLQTIDNDLIRNNIIYVDQSSKLFDRKIIDNILYGCETTDPHCITHFNNIKNKFSKINEIINKLDINSKSAGFHGNQLSGGQRQIVNILNGLIQNAKVIIIDEPTNALDPGLKKEIIELIHMYKTYKKAIIVITHDKDMMQKLDQKIKLQD